MKCTCCGQTIRTPKAAQSRVVVPVDVAALTDAELFAYRKKTAPYEDLRFWIERATMSATLRAMFVAFAAANQQTALPRAEFYRQFSRLQGLWRRESNERERQAHIDAGETLVREWWSPEPSLIDAVA